MLKFASICPHPPIIIPTIGKKSDIEKVSETIEAMEKLSQDFAKASPKTVFIISPHGPIDFDRFTLINSPILKGHFYNFGDFKTELVFENDLEVINELKEFCSKEEIPLKVLNSEEIDHGTLVPLYYLSKHYQDFKIVPLVYSFSDIESHLKFGEILAKTANQKKSIAIIASGDLSHRLTPEAPAGFSPKAKKFDEKIIESLKKKDIEEILNIEPELIEEAGECAYRSILILLGALKDIDWQPEVLSYQAPFGVGYLVFNFKLAYDYS